MVCYRELNRNGHLVSGGNHSWYDNDNEKNDDSGNQTHAHLHILPPHLFPNSVCSPSESLGRDGKVVGLVLKRIQSLASL